VKKALFFPLALLVFCAAELNAGIRFFGLDLSGERLLFAASSSRDTRSQLFLARLGSLSASRLSALPERLEILDGGKTLLVQNAYGIQSVPVSGGLPRAVPGFSSAFGGEFAAPGTSRAAVPSEDGKWLLFVDPVSHARGDLVLLERATGERRVVSRDMDRPGRLFPAVWSLDSRFFLYMKAGKLYFYTAGGNSLPPSDERRRLIGEGRISSLCRTEGGFYYLKGSSLRIIRSADLAAKFLYPRVLEAGENTRTIPFEFDPVFDSYWMSEDGSSMIFSRAGRNVFYYPLEETPETPLPYIKLSSSFSLRTVLWDEGIVTILAGERDGNSLAYRIDGGAFIRLEIPAAAAALSPDGKKVVIWGNEGAVLYDYQNWEPLQTLTEKPALSCVWLNGKELVVGGGERIERFFLEEGEEVQSALVCLSSVSEYGFDEGGNSIAARSGAFWFVTDGTAPWTETDPPALKEPSRSSSRYRVFLDERSSGFFDNMPMVRSLGDAKTFPLFPASGIARKSLARERIRKTRPSEMEGVFAHGSRSSSRVALSFDLYDDDTGLYYVLNVLSQYGITGNFFLNGEFIRRHPDGAAAIAEAGHETGSMFYAPIDLSDARYGADRDFIARGLARNEDEFHGATGGELALLWHPPWYAVSPEIAAYASRSGYKTVGRDMDTGDWISRAEARRIGMEEPSAADIIDTIMDSIENGSIVPIRLGILPGGRSDYLFDRLELLLDAIIRSGYEIVPVSRL
jgi:peptidoglycan/xylan/chitin deacetylase (PgdA/CDA1 family)